MHTQDTTNEVPRYRIAADADNWVVMERRIAGDKAKEPGKVNEVPVAYFKHLSNCASWIFTREARMKTELLGLLAAFDAARDETIKTVVEHKP